MTLEETIYMKIGALAIAALKAFERGAGRLLLAAWVCAGRGASSDSRTILRYSTLRLGDVRHVNELAVLREPSLFSARARAHELAYHRDRMLPVHPSRQAPP